jgi:hypothetical protein
MASLTSRQRRLLAATKIYSEIAILAPWNHHALRAKSLRLEPFTCMLPEWHGEMQGILYFIGYVFSTSNSMYVALL